MCTYVQNIPARNIHTRPNRRCPRKIRTYTYTSRARESTNSHTLIHSLTWTQDTQTNTHSQTHSQIHNKLWRTQSSRLDGDHRHVDVCIARILPVNWCARVATLSSAGARARRTRRRTIHTHSNMRMGDVACDGNSRSKAATAQARSRVWIFTYTIDSNLPIRFDVSHKDMFSFTTQLICRLFRTTVYEKFREKFKDRAQRIFFFSNKTLI